MRNFLQAALAVVICELAGSIGSLFTMPSIPGWYTGLNKSPLNPPSWVFGPVWTTLFALMGLAAYLVWRTGWSQPVVKTALILFVAQLALNVLWSVLFFGMHNPGLAFIEIFVLLASMIVTTAYFFRVSNLAGILMLPYILWVSFASYLNYSVWALNRL